MAFPVEKSSKVTSAQLNLILDFMESHKALLSNKFIGPQGRQIHKDLWEQLCLQLNSEGNGPVKPISKWQKVWRDWKCATRAKKVKIEQHRRGTGGGPPQKMFLSDIEEHLINLLGDVSFKGDDDVPEVGLGVTENPGEEDITSSTEETTNVAPVTPSGTKKQSSSSTQKRKRCEVDSSQTSEFLALQMDTNNILREISATMAKQTDAITRMAAAIEALIYAKDSSS